jgi:hypothetical protein
MNNEDHKRRGWKISPGRGGEDWELFSNKGIAAFYTRPWEQDLQPAASRNRDELQNNLRHWNKGPERLTEAQLAPLSRQLWYIYNEMQLGDKIYAYGKKRVLGCGTITGGYRFENDLDLGNIHCRKVDWEPTTSFSTDKLSNALRTKIQLPPTIIELSPEESKEIQMIMPETRQPEVVEILDESSILSLISGNLSVLGFSFSKWQIATFFTALQTKGFVILSGISGTGKTKLAQHFAALLPQPEGDRIIGPDQHPGTNLRFISVRPDWRDSKGLLGYYNPLTETYQWTPFLRFLLQALRSYRAKDGMAWFVILDEMNLSHVEYYFADLLSVLESGRTEDGCTRECLELSYPDDAVGDLPPCKLYLPPNLYIVGTINVDETTHSFSPKVLDRAFTMELTEADFSKYLTQTDLAGSDLTDEQRRAILKVFTRDQAFAQINKEQVAGFLAKHPEIRARLQSLNRLLRDFDMHFGYRVFDEIVAFLDAAEANGMYQQLGSGEPAFDAAVLMKVLPKFHGPRGKLEEPLKSVLAWCINPDSPDHDRIAKALSSVESGHDAVTLLKGVYSLPCTADRAIRMIRTLYTTGFAAFG